MNADSNSGATQHRASDVTRRAGMSAPTVEATGNRIILDFESLEEAMRLLVPWPNAAKRADVAAKLSQSLAAIGLAVELRVKGRSVAEFAGGAMRGSLLSLIRGAARAD